MAQVFGERTFSILQKMRVAVVGCSGTGSLLSNNWFGIMLGGLVVLVDPDVVEYKSLNRIWNATPKDAEHKVPKVEVAARAARAIGLARTSSALGIR